MIIINNKNILRLIDKSLIPECANTGIRHYDDDNGRTNSFVLTYTHINLKLWGKYKYERDVLLLNKK